MRLTFLMGVVAFSSRGALAGYVMTDSNIYTARDAWLANPTSAEATYGHISTWETGGVTDMSYLFCAVSDFWYAGLGCNTAKASFNEDISAWDTSGVTNMEGMFYHASAFSRDIGGWAVGQVRSMREMFRGATRFNRPIGGWNLSNVTDMLGMFYDAHAFNQPLDSWNVSNVTEMSCMFMRAHAFTKPRTCCKESLLKKKK